MKRVFFFQLTAISAVTLVLSALLYSWVFVASPCSICMLQRYLLLIIMSVSLISLWRNTGSFVGVWGIRFLIAIGILLSIRHIYVLLYGEAATSCLPFDVLIDLPWGSMLIAIKNWVLSLGRHCGAEQSVSDYTLVATLLAYYGGMMVSSFLIESEKKNEPLC